MTTINDSSNNGHQLVVPDETSVIQESSATKWVFSQKLQPFGENARNSNDSFGFSMAKTDTYLFVGAPNHSYDVMGSSALAGAGAIWVYKSRISTLQNDAVSYQNKKSVFTFTGNDQFFDVPEGVTKIRVKAWAAAGGSSTSARGGAGGYLEGIIKVVPGEQLTIIVGEGGINLGNARTYGGGGGKFAGAHGASGGGRTAIRRTYWDVVTVGGGGGAGFAAGGAGGGLSGQLGKMLSYTNTSQTPATNYTTGTINYPFLINPSSYGGQFSGGDARAYVFSDNGAGGGGYFGGNAGISYVSNNASYNVGGGGAGGSSNYDTHAFAAISDLSESFDEYKVTTSGGDYISVPNTTDEDYIAGVATPAMTTEKSGNGLVVLSWDEPVVVNDFITNTSWDNDIKITPSGLNARQENDNFGFSVSALGNWLFVGAPNHDYDDQGNTPIDGAGAVWVFKYDQVVKTWVQHSKLVAPTRRASMKFGYSLACSSTILLVGAPFDSFDSSGANELAESGSVYVFRYNYSTDSWNFVLDVVPSDRSADAHFGSSVDLYGYRFAISAPMENQGKGSAYTYNLSNNQAIFEKKFTSPTGISGDQYGSSLSLQGSVISIGVKNADQSDVYSFANGSWSVLTTFKDQTSSSSIIYLNHFEGSALSNFTNEISPQDTSSSIGSVFSSSVSKFGVTSIGFNANNANSYNRMVTSSTLSSMTSIFTIDFWTRITNQKTNSTTSSFGDIVIAEKLNSWSFKRILTKKEASAGYLGFTINQASGTFTVKSKNKVPFDKWLHIAGMKFGTKIYLYIDGILVGYTDCGSGSILTNNNGLTFGSKSFAGYLDEFRITNDAQYIANNIPVTKFAVPQFPYSLTSSLKEIGSSTQVLNDNLVAISAKSFAGKYSPMTDKAITSSFSNNYSNIQNSGGVYILTRDNDANFSPREILTAPGVMTTRSSSNFGKSISLNAGKLVIGAPKNSYNITQNEYLPNSGAVFVFDYDGKGFIPVTKMVSSDRSLSNQNFGDVVSTNGQDIVATSANYEKIIKCWDEYVADYFTRSSFGSYFGQRVEQYEVLAGSTLLRRMDNGNLSVTNRSVSGNGNYIGFNEIDITSVANFPITNPIHIKDVLVTLDQTMYQGIPDYNGYGTIIARYKSGNSWVETQIAPQTGFTGNRTYTNEYFGTSIKTDGQLIFAGVPGFSYDSLGNSYVPNSGIVQVFHNPTGGEWSVKATLIGQRSSQENFGSDVDYDGTSLFVSGRAMTKKFFGSNFNSNIYYSVHSEFSNILNVSLSNDRLVVGDPANFGFGISYLFDVQGTNFNNLGNIQAAPNNEANGRNANDKFGYSLDTNGSVLAVGSPGFDYDASSGNTISDIGAVTFFGVNNGYWEKLSRFNSGSTLTTNSAFGTKVDMSGTSVAVLANSGQTSSLLKSSDSKSWTLSREVSSTGISDISAISDLSIIVGLPSYNLTGVAQGGAFQETKMTTGWTTKAYTTPEITNGSIGKNNVQYNSSLASNARMANDKFGSSVGIKPDKSVIFVGSPEHSIGVDGPSRQQSSGAIFAYHLDGTWKLQGKYLGTNTANYKFGQKIAVSDNSLITSFPSYASNSGITQTMSLSGTGYSTTGSYYSYQLGVLSSSFGSSLQLTSTKAFVGSSGSSIANFDKLGSVIQYNFTGTTLTAATNIIVTGDSQGRNANDQFGSSLTIDNGKFYIGAKGQSYSQDGNTFVSGAGAIYCFTYDSSSKAISFNEKVFTGVAKLGEKYLSASNGKLISSGSTGYSILDKTTGSWVQTVVNSSNLTKSFFDGVNFINFSKDSRGFQKINISSNSSGSITTSYTKSPEFMNFQNVILPARYLASSSYPIGNNVSISPDGLLMAVSNPLKPVQDTTYTKISNGEILLFKFNAIDGRFDYWASAYSPENIPNGSFGKSIDLTNDTLIVGCGNNLMVQYRINDFGVSIEKMINVSLPNVSNVQAVKTPDGVAIGYPVHNGEEYNGTSIGQVNEYLDVEPDVAELMLGGNARANTNSQSCSGAGGGGYKGGSAGVVGYNKAFGGYGGTNLVPNGWTERVGTLNKNYNSTASKSVGDGGSYSGDSGSNGRLILTYGGNSYNYDFKGTPETFVVPDGITNINIKMFGAGGGAGRYVSSMYYVSPTGMGGAGAYLEGNIAVTPGDIFEISVGQGGLGGMYSDSETPTIYPKERIFGGGGIGNVGNSIGVTPSFSFTSGYGGGMTSLKKNGTYMAIAGGGGGGACVFYQNPYSYQVDTISSSLHGRPAGLVDAETNDSSIKTLGKYLKISPSGNANTMSTNEKFGSSIVISDDTNLYVGSPNNSWKGNTQVSNSGSVYHYTKQNGLWKFSKKIDNTTLTKNTGFGSLMSGSNGSIFVVSDDTLDNLSKSTLDRIADSTQKISIIDSSDNVQDIKDTTLWAKTLFVQATSPTQYVIGHPGANLVVGPASLNDVGTIETATFDTSWTSNVEYPSGARFGRFVNDRFGTSVEVGDSWVAIGAPGNGFDANGETYASGRGLVNIFNKSQITGKWSFSEKLSPDSAYVSYSSGFGSVIKYKNGILYVSTSNCRYVETFDNTFTSIDHKGFTGINSNMFGVDSLGQIVIGEYQSNTGKGMFPDVQGAGRISVWNNGAIVDTLIAPGLSYGRNTNDQFGTSVYTNGSYVAVGSLNHSRNSYGAQLTDYTGAVFVFGEDFAYEAKLTSTRNSSHDIGQMLAGSGNYLATGQNSVQGSVWNSYVEVFERLAPKSWSSINTISETSADSTLQNSALAVMTNGTTVMGRPTATGSSISNTPALAGSGTFKTVQHVGSSWLSLGETRMPGASNGRNANDLFGSRMATSSNFIAVGVPNHSFDEIGNPTVGGTGTVFLYSNEGQNSKLVARITMPIADMIVNANFGSSLDIDDSGRYMVVGAPGANKAYVYDLLGNTISLNTTLSGTGTFGAAVAVNDGKVAVGAINLSSSGIAAGAVMVYGLTETGWMLESTVTPFVNTSYYDPQHPENFGISYDNAKNSGDLMGYSVGISRRALVIGAPGQDTDELGNRTVLNAGAVYFRHI